MAQQRITIAMITYNRMDYALQTIAALKQHIKIADGWTLNFHIADDGSPDHYVDKLWSCVEPWPFNGQISSSNSKRGGFGANYNLAMKVCHQFSDYMLVMDDDWVLSKDLDLSFLCQVFDDNPQVGCIRLGYLGYTASLRGEFIASNNVKYLLLDPLSDEPHVFASHPRLETVEWEQFVGEWPEGMLPGETEFYVATHIARHGIVWPCDLVNTSGSLFKHIGAVQSKEFMVEPLRAAAQRSY